MATVHGVPVIMPKRTRAQRDRQCSLLWWWGEVNARARARGHARLRAYEHGRVV